MAGKKQNMAPMWKKQMTNVDVDEPTSGLNHGPVWETQSFLMSGICTVILWQDCDGKAI